MEFQRNSDGIYNRIRSYSVVYDRIGCIRFFLLNNHSNNAIAFQLLFNCFAVALQLHRLILLNSHSLV